HQPTHSYTLSLQRRSSDLTTSSHPMCLSNRDDARLTCGVGRKSRNPREYRTTTSAPTAAGGRRSDRRSEGVRDLSCQVGRATHEIGRASCRERVEIEVGDG